MRNYVRKTDRGKTPCEVIERAIDVVLTEERGITEVGELFQIPRRSLARYVDKKKNELSSKQKYGYAKIRQVRNTLRDYTSGIFTPSCRIYFGLSPMDVRKLAFQLATKMNIKTPLTWNAKCIAGPDWFSSFLKRHNSLPFPKAGPRINPQNNGRRKRTSAVLTDTPVKNVIEAEKAAVKTKASRKIVLSEQQSNSKAEKSKPAKRNVEGVIRPLKKIGFVVQLENVAYGHASRVWMTEEKMKIHTCVQSALQRCKANLPRLHGQLAPLTG
ncbi:hypothetical protein GHT06_020297 [Daphnia sinensis]|uniref:HTH psq-type domain-containing protein n=1 Tax=Daphnia sinensis TaxID=1820382 RepID=A0AAD5L485_9CRUS|nr:hypothetical protein GHT06_020297 [Daphnia sinensis]